MSTYLGQKRVLFVDDEASIRLTLPRVLQEGGFEVRVASSVPEALVEINCAQFDILISDLNIGEEGDGFLVVSAMRHLQPGCVNFILTGYPAFETALQAIHNQVDDYLVKPIDVEALMNALRAKLIEPSGRPSRKTLSSLLNDCRTELAGQIVKKLEIHRTGKKSGSADPEHAVDVAKLLSVVVEQLEGNGQELSPDAADTAVSYGRQRYHQGCTVAALTRDFQLLRSGGYDLIQKYLPEMDMQVLIGDLRRADDCYQMLAEKALEGFMTGQGSDV